MPHPIDRIATGQKTVTSTATEIVPSRLGRAGIKITKIGSQDLYIGCSNVTTTNGELIAGGCGAYLVLPTTDAVYGIVAAGDIRVSYVEIHDG